MCSERCSDERSSVSINIGPLSALVEGGLSVISVYGSEDRVLDMDKYEQYRSNLPETAEEIVLSGGNHAGFGSYGVQEGDGSATISPGEQRGMTVDSMLAFFE